MKIKENTKIYKALVIAKEIYAEKGQDDNKNLTLAGIKMT